jgi:hypothetical protein
MNYWAKVISLMALCCAAGAAWAQQQQPPAGTPPSTPPPAAPSTTTPPAATPAAVKPNRATAQSEAGDPRADTSSPPATSEPATSPAPTAAAPAPSTGREPAARAAAGRAPSGSGSGQKAASKTDRLDLGTATVTGDREQPKVMYIVPWKRSDIGDLTGKPMNSLVDEILAPVDRDVFKREVVYYRAVQADASQNGAQPKPGQQVEK